MSMSFTCHLRANRIPYAHTVPGKNDEINEAAGLCIKNLLDVVKPRMVTLEQTDGYHLSSNNLLLMLHLLVRRSRLLNALERPAHQ